jgi:hypothetical protein
MQPQYHGSTGSLLQYARNIQKRDTAAQSNTTLGFQNTARYRKRAASACHDGEPHGIWIFQPTMFQASTSTATLRCVWQNAAVRSQNAALRQRWTITEQSENVYYDCAPHGMRQFQVTRISQLPLFALLRNHAALWIASVPQA